jgi:hypothetical protein
VIDETISRPLRDALATVRADRTALRVRLGDQELSESTITQLKQELATAIYGRWHAGNAEDPSEDRDPEFDAQLREHTPHDWTERLGTRAPGAGFVVLDGVRVAVPDSWQLADGPEGTVRVPAVRPNLSPGFFLVDGSRGTGLTDGQTLRMYVHLADARTAPVAWRAVVSTLEADDVPYRAKILSRRADYPRRDALVVYLGRAAWGAAPALVAALDAVPGRAPETSVFVKRLADGVGIAWEPSDSRPGMSGRSFGQHRAFAVAGGLLAEHGDGDPIGRALRAANVDPSDPSRNLDSPVLPF